MPYSLYSLKQYGEIIRCIDEPNTQLYEFTSEFFERLRHIVYFDKADIMFYSYDKESKKYYMHSFYPYNWQESEAENYINTYIQMDDVLSILDQPGYIAYRNNDMFSPDARKKTKYFENFAASADLEISIDANIPLSERYEFTAILGIFRGTNKMPFDEDSLGIIRSLQPHLSRGIEMRLDAASPDTAAPSGFNQRFIDSLDFIAVFTMNEDLRITFGNEPFHSLVQELGNDDQDNPLTSHIKNLAQDLMRNPDQMKIRPLPIVIDEKTFTVQIAFSNPPDNTEITGVIYLTTKMFKSQLDRLKLTYHLSDREYEIIFLLIKKGLSNNEIADVLFITPATVKRHLYNIYQKIGINTQKELLQMLHIM